MLEESAAGNAAVRAQTQSARRGRRQQRARCDSESDVNSVRVRCAWRSERLQRIVR